jgi:hypothetical protein
MDQSQKKYVIGTFGVLLLAILLALTIQSCAKIYPLRIFIHLFVRYDLWGAVLLISILFAAIMLARKIKDSWADDCLGCIGNNPVPIALSAFLFLSLGAYFIYRHYPLCMDEYMPYFQARIFAAGKLWGQYPPNLIPWLLKPGFFSVFSAETGRVVSDYWPGFALLLTPFMKLGIPWLLNPLISAGTLLLIFYYARRILPGNDSASWVVLLTISSSVFMVNGISFYSMGAHLFFNLLFSVLLLHISPLRLFLAGLAGSFALVLHNPIPHFAFALPWIVWIAFGKQRFRNLGILFAGYLPITLFLGVGWVGLKLFIEKGGSETLSNPGIGVMHAIQKPINFSLFTDNNPLMLFGNKTWELLHHSFRLPGSKLLLARLIGCLKLFIWSMPGLPILAVFGIRHLKAHLHIKLWGCSAAFTLWVYFFVPFDQGHGWGFRYFHSVWLALPLLAAAFLASSGLKDAAYWKKLICIASLLSVIFCTGLNFFQVRQFIGRHLSQLPVLEKNKKCLCIVNTNQGYYTKDLVHNDPFLRDPIIMFKSINSSSDSEMVHEFFPEAINVKHTAACSIWEIAGK